MLNSLVKNNLFGVIEMRKTRVQRIIKQCGYYAAAKYLQRRGYTLEQAHTLIFGS